jgi:hypothetical protein
MEHIKVWIKELFWKKLLIYTLTIGKDLFIIIFIAINNNNMKIYVDFDGTIVEHAFPKIGREVPHAMRVIKRLEDAGHTLYLNTVRTEMDPLMQEEMAKAMEYVLMHYKVELNGILKTEVKIHPVWDPTDKEKIFIDDIATGIPLIPAVYDGDNMVDWLAVELILMENKIL